MDLRANGVNDAVATPERQVLPTVFHHGRDVAVLAAELQMLGPEAVLATMVLDLKDAFMGVPLAAAERPFNTCAVDLPIRRTRPPCSSCVFAVRTVVPPRGPKRPEMRYPSCGQVRACRPTVTVSTPTS